MTPNDLPLVSIVTPSFNQRPYLEAAIRSVLDQDYPHIEYIVIDGGSTDGSLDVLRAHAAQISLWMSEPDSGQTEAINKGFSKANGDILAWLNSDDVYRPGAIREAVAYLREHAEVGMVYGDADYIDSHGRVVGQFPAAQTDGRRLMRGYVHIPQQASFFRSRLWRMVGPLDETYRFAMDYDLWTRLAEISTMRYVRRTWAAFRLHGTAKTLAASYLCWPEMIRIHRRQGGGRFSVIYAKYLLRRLLEPLMVRRYRAVARRLGD